MAIANPVGGISLLGAATNRLTPNGAGTIALWTNSNGNTAIETMFMLRVDGTNEISIDDLHGVASLNMRAKYPGLTINVPSQNASTGWSLLAITWDKTADQFKFFVSGAQVGTTQTGLGTYTGTIAFHLIGDANGGGYPFGGDMAEYAAWNVALNDAEIAMLGKGMPASRVRPSALCNYSPLNQGLAIDRVANAIGSPPSAQVKPHPAMLPAESLSTVMI